MTGKRPREALNSRQIAELVREVSISTELRSDLLRAGLRPDSFGVQTTTTDSVGIFIRVSQPVLEELVLSGGWIKQLFKLTAMTYARVLGQEKMARALTFSFVQLEKAKLGKVWAEAILLRQDNDVYEFAVDVIDSNDSRVATGVLSFAISAAAAIPPNPSDGS